VAPYLHRSDAFTYRSNHVTIDVEENAYNTIYGHNDEARGGSSVSSSHHLRLEFNFQENIKYQSNGIGFVSGSSSVFSIYEQFCNRTANYEKCKLARTP